MKQAICIVSWSGGEDAGRLCLNSFGHYYKYPIYVVVNDAHNISNSYLQYLSKRANVILMENDLYECGAITAMVTLGIDEFILLQDTMEVKNPSIFDKMFEKYPQKSVVFGHNGAHFFLKWRTEILKNIEIPKTDSKSLALLAEHTFSSYYLSKEPNQPIPLLFPNFKDTNPDNYWEERWGRKNLVLVNDYIIKRKGTWGADVILPDLLKENIDTEQLEEEI